MIGRMSSWNEFAAAAPDLAAHGRRLFERYGAGEALLATVRGDATPRIHPINIAIVDGRLLGFLIVGSSKLADVAADGRYALHAHQDRAEPHEFLVRGHAVELRTRPCARPRRPSGRSRWTTAIASSSSTSSTRSSANGPTPTRGPRATRPGGARRRARNARPHPRRQAKRRVAPMSHQTRPGSGGGSAPAVSAATQRADEPGKRAAKTSG